ncbi:MAG: hypothetical protein JWL76_1977 [Thermoleophilia bacterium]|nr:hypothetical protein [Thermoleophilia bacterium]
MSVFEMKFRLGAILIGPVFFVAIGCKFAYRLSTRGTVNDAVPGHRFRQAIGTVCWILVGVFIILAGILSSPWLAAASLASLLLACAAFKLAEADDAAVTSDDGGLPPSGS